MVTEKKPRSPNLLARLLKLIGKLTDPKATTTGKVWSTLERGMTSAMGRLAGNAAYLNFAGRMMEQRFLFQAEATRSTEAVIRAMGLPTASELDELRDQVRR